MVLRIVLILVLLIVIYIANAFAHQIPQREVDENFKPQYGVSYSFEHAQWYGLDPRKAYIELLDKLKVDWVRLPFFWDQMIDENGDLRIDDLEFAIQEAGKRDIKVIIALGAKTPYYPEYHLPTEIKSQVKFGDTIDIDHPIADEILQIDKKVVEQLAGFENISHWQIENEPFLASINNLKIASSLIAREIKVVKEADPKRRPIILNHVGPAAFDKRHRRLLELLSAGDVLGINAYFKTQGVDLLAFKILGKEVHIKWPKWLVFPVQSWLFLSPDYRTLANEAKARDVGFWILEMQAEPYIRNRADADSGEFYYKAADIVAAYRFLRSNGISTIGLWGAPFWLYRQSIGDNSWMESVKLETRD